MITIRQQDNAVSLEQRGFVPSLRGSMEISSTSEVLTTLNPLMYSQRTGPCVLVFFVPSDHITYHCEDLIDINDVIAKYTSTPKGKKAMQRAEDELHRELYQEVLAGRLNRIKYYRLVNNMDQKTLSELSGIMQPNISRLEKRGYTGDAKTYKKLARVFKIPYKELLP